MPNTAEKVNTAARQPVRNANDDPVLKAMNDRMTYLQEINLIAVAEFRELQAMRDKRLATLGGIDEGVPRDRDNPQGQAVDSEVPLKAVEGADTDEDDTEGDGTFDAANIDFSKLPMKNDTQVDMRNATARQMLNAGLLTEKGDYTDMGTAMRDAAPSTTRKRMSTRDTATA